MGGFIGEPSAIDVKAPLLQQGLSKMHELNSRAIATNPSHISAVGGFLVDMH